VGLEDVEQASSMISESCSPDASVIWGVAFDPDLEDEMRITIVAAGFDKEEEAVEEAPVVEQPAEEEVVAEEPKKNGDLLDDFFGNM